MTEFDYIVVGAGSAGCVMARRLAEQPDVTVALVEAGPNHADWSINMPAAVSINIKRAKYNWQYRTQPQAELLGRTLYQPRGRVMGGSSAINGMIFIRGHALDFDGWADGGASGWSYAEVLPYFRRLEDFEGGESLYRGAGGPIPVDRGVISNPLHAAFLQAGEQAGHALTNDVNGYRQAGVSLFDKNIRNGERWSAARGYLEQAPTEIRSRISIVADTLVDRVVVSRRRAEAVVAIGRQGPYQLSARRQIVLCAGAFNSPAILMRSGIGEADKLKRLGIAVAADLPGVGKNLQDHTEVHIQHLCTEPITLFADLKPLARIAAGARWFLDRSGKAATNHYDSGAFLLTDPSVSHPDVQLHFVPIIYNNSVERKVTAHGYRVHAGPMRPHSRGTVALVSADPRAMPIIQPNYLTKEADWRDMRRIVELSREIFAQDAFRRFRGPELSPGSTQRNRSEIDSFIREWADTGYHPAGTCKMGAGNDAVVSPEGRVHQVEGLSVCDASIMPRIVSGNLNASVMMMAERISDLIAGRRPADRVDAPFFERSPRR